MNSWGRRAVKTRAGRIGAASRGASLVLLLLGVSSCVQVDGGAIELSWTLRTFDGEVIASNRDEACRRARIEQIQVCWQSLGSGVDAGEELSCAPGRSRSFACREDRGVTQFEVPPGPTAIWLEPQCADGAPPVEGSYEVPAPVVREVRDGEVAALLALLVVATDGDRACPGSGCTCAR